MTKKESKQLKSYLFRSCLAKVVLKSDLVNILSHHSCHRDRETQKPMNTFKATPSLPCHGQTLQTLNEATM